MTRAFEPSTTSLQPSWTTAGAVSAHLLVPALIAASILSLGFALQTNFGQFHPQAMPWLAVAVISTMAAVVRSKRNLPVAAPVNRSIAAKIERFLWLGTIAGLTVSLLGREPTAKEAIGEQSLAAFRIAVFSIAVMAAAGLLAGRRSRTWFIAGMLAAYFIAGVIVLRTHVVPNVDVVHFQNEACDALRSGTSPYGITFADFWSKDHDLYAPGVSVGGRLLFGFPYPPLSLLLILPFQMLGDFRFAGLLAMTAAGGLIAFSSPSRRSLAAAAMLLLTPMGFFVIWAGWTEPLAVLLLAQTVFFARCGLPPLPVLRGRVGLGALANNEPRAEKKSGPHPSPPPGHLGSEPGMAFVVAFALLLAIKQYSVLFLPLIPLLFPRGKRLRSAIYSIAIAAAITLPFALWDIRGFVHSVVTLQFGQPYRADALSFLAPLHDVLPHAAAAAIPFGLAFVAAVWLLKISHRTPAGFALAAGVLLLVFFAFNKQAFCNYYHLVIGALAVALAMTSDADDGTPQRHRHSGAVCAREV